jgi:hypothetical protein
MFEVCPRYLIEFEAFSLICFLPCPSNRYQRQSCFRITENAFAAQMQVISMSSQNNFHQNCSIYLISKLQGQLFLYSWVFNLSNGVTDTLEFSSILIHLIRAKGIYT